MPYSYTYDAWGRLATVKRAYRDANNLLHKPSTVATINYDGLGRRTAKKIENSGDWNETYHFYYEKIGDCPAFFIEKNWVWAEGWPFQFETPSLLAAAIRALPRAVD